MRSATRTWLRVPANRLSNPSCVRSDSHTKTNTSLCTSRGRREWEEDGVGGMMRCDGSRTMRERGLACPWVLTTELTECLASATLLSCMRQSSAGARQASRHRLRLRLTQLLCAAQAVMVTVVMLSVCCCIAAAVAATGRRGEALCTEAATRSANHRSGNLAMSACRTRVGPKSQLMQLFHMGHNLRHAFGTAARIPSLCLPLSLTT